MYIYCERVVPFGITCTCGLQWSCSSYNPVNMRQQTRSFPCTDGSTVLSHNGPTRAYSDTGSSLHLIFTPHARLYPTVVAIPSVGESGTGANAKFKKLNGVHLLACRLFSYSVHHAVSSPRDCVLAVAAMPPAFHAPPELRRICKVVGNLGSYALQNLFPCIRKASHPERMGLI